MFLRYKFGGKRGGGLPNPKWRKYKGLKSLKKVEAQNQTITIFLRSKMQLNLIYITSIPSYKSLNLTHLQSYKY